MLAVPGRTVLSGALRGLRSPPSLSRFSSSVNSDAAKEPIKTISDLTGPISLPIGHSSLRHPTLPKLSPPFRSDLEPKCVLAVVSLSWSFIFYWPESSNNLRFFILLMRRMLSRIFEWLRFLTDLREPSL